MFVPRFPLTYVSGMLCVCLPFPPPLHTHTLHPVPQASVPMVVQGRAGRRTAAPLLLALLSALLAAVCEAQTDTSRSARVMGLGWGTFVILLLVILALVFCVVAQGMAAPLPRLAPVIGIGLVVVVFLILWGWPRKDRNDDGVDPPTSRFWAVLTALAVLVWIGALVSLLVLCNYRMVSTVRAGPVGSFSMAAPTAMPAGGGSLPKRE